ncbi:hypothetical protein GSI_08504 [Ganoderma sinense ZZ0214-1]|uniref:Uncharacterized protein n=1 Tax=Ganoderma sinense ZZ0214-1 TaxID=1077348 RepID=A0A2G8S3W5_9APHY|nr:hypothetical protein GSI_08504 [Ganoderma sinense ZZ0214-1]
MAYPGSMKGSETGQKRSGSAVLPNSGNRFSERHRRANGALDRRAIVAITPLHLELSVALLPLFVAPPPLSVAPPPLFVAPPLRASSAPCRAAKVSFAISEELHPIPLVFQVQRNSVF